LGGPLLRAILNRDRAANLSQGVHHSTGTTASPQHQCASTCRLKSALPQRSQESSAIGIVTEQALALHSDGIDCPNGTRVGGDPVEIG
jgi:hypothetical protein